MTLEELAEAFPEADGENLAMALDLLRPFGALVSVRCGDQELRLPDRNNLWRGLQFWGLVTGRLTIDFTRFCLAGNCEQCAMKIARRSRCAASPATSRRRQSGRPASRPAW